MRLACSDLTRQGRDSLGEVGINECMRSAAAAQYLGIAESTLNKSRLTGDGPPFVKVGSRSVVYRKADLDKFLEDRVRRSTSECVAEKQPHTLKSNAVCPSCGSRGDL